MPGKLVHTNEVTALLGDNWFAKCSAKQAQKVVDHRMKCESVSVLSQKGSVVSIYYNPLTLLLLMQQRALLHQVWIACLTTEDSLK